MAKAENGRFMRVIQAFGMTFGALMSFLFFLVALLLVIAVLVPSHELTSGNVAVVPITGEISTDGKGDLLERGGTDSATVVGWLKEAAKDSKTKAILLEIDSPGGSPVATDEIARAVKDAAKNKTVVAVIRESGASGAYWVATAADYIVANPMSMTGSIGVIGSHLEFAGLLQDYNVTYRRLVAGKYKDAGSRWKEMTPEEQALFQNVLDEVRDDFIAAVATNRHLPEDKVRELATGFVLTGAKAKDAGLIDALGTKDDAVRYIEQKLNITASLYEFKSEKNILRELIGVSSTNVGKGIGTVLLSQAASEEVKIST